MNVEKFISPLIESQFPSFYKEEGPNFIAFVKAYYEWAEQQGNFLSYSRNLYDIKDVDSSPVAFIKYFKNKYISSLPESIIADKRLLVKHILDLYRAKGSERAYELLFRLLFNEDVTFYLPGQHIFKPSEASWVIPKYIEVTDHPNLKDLVGRMIYSKKDGSAVVENYFIKIVNNKTVNVLTLSDINGSFKYNEEIYCDDIPEIYPDNAPVIFGSLSSVSIINGGSGFNIGDFLDVNGSGMGGIARVASTRNENGKVEFNLIDGGKGFTVNAIVTVTGGGAGAGASFAVGGITDKEVYLINDDIIDDYKGLELDILSLGFDLTISDATGAFENGETITTGTINTRSLDVAQVSTTVAANGESFSNSSLSISGLTAYRVDGSCIHIFGSNTNLNNANLVPGVILVSNTSGALISVNTIFPIKSSSASGTVVEANTSVITVDNVTGYFYPGCQITGSAHSYTANVTTTTRNTDWEFPYAVAINKLSNLDSDIKYVLKYDLLETGTITYLKNVNPGSGYSSNPTISIVEPKIYDLKKPDGKGGYYGYDAIVTGMAGTANGVVTAAEIVDSGFGYTPDETVYLSSNTNPTSVYGTAVVDLNGTGLGSWADNKSFTSDTINIQDSDYYQDFSYELIASRMFDTYQKFVVDLIHPSGLKLFGRYALNSYITDNEAEPIDFYIT